MKCFPSGMRICAVGAYGFGNFGDDYYAHVLRESRPDVEWTFLPELSEYRPFYYDFTVVAGGGILYDRTAPRGQSSLRHYLRYPAAAQWFDKCTAMLGTGIQGKIAPNAIEPFVEVLSRLQVCAVRDRMSADLLRHAGVSSVVECADLVYASRTTPRHRAEASRPVLGVVASQPGAGWAHRRYEGFEGRIVESLDQLARVFDIHLFSFDNRVDTWIRDAWKGASGYTAFNAESAESVTRFVDALGQVDILLTSRYHGAVVSFLNGTPVVPIGAPGQKTFVECESIDYPVRLEYDEPPGRIVSAVRDVWDQRAPIVQSVAANVNRRRALGRRNFDLLSAAMWETNVLLENSHDEFAEAARGGRVLLVWAAADHFWVEAAALRHAAGPFDCLAPADSGLDAPGILRLDPPGLFHWKAFGTDLVRKLEGKYDVALVCHESSEDRIDRLIEIGAMSACNVWSANVWNRTLRRADPRLCESFRGAGKILRPVLSRG